MCTRMDNDSDHIINFEPILKNKLRKQQIYNENIFSGLCPKENYTPKDVLSNISKQLNALQRADGMTTNKNRLRLRKVVKPALEPVNLLSLDNNPSTLKEAQSNKFETQGVSDTQLINIVINSEIMATMNGVTQEFESSFLEHHIERKTYSPNVSPVIGSKKDSYLVENKVKDPLTLDDVPRTSKICIDNEKQNTDSYENTYIEMLNENSEDDTTLSAIISHKGSLELPKPSLIFTLDAFESFESLAFPFIEQNPDIDLAKAINSQIIDTELCLTIANPTTSRYRSKSPILTKTILETKNNPNSDKANKEPDKVIEKRIKPKKSFEEDIFCSDEENVEEEDFRELPETCPLDLLSNPKDTVEKTIYVGFQTASNKSIQIHVDTLCKAQNILNEVDGNNPTIMELVEMCDNASKNQSTAHSAEVDKPVSDIKTHYNEDKFGNKLNANNSCVTKELKLASEEKTIANLDGDKSKHILNKAKNRKDVGFVGFKTASSKKINLSDKALARCHQIFQDINLDEIFDPKDALNASNSRINRGDQMYDANETWTHYNEKDRNELTEESEQIALIDQTILEEFENDLLADSENIHQKNKIVNSMENYKEHVINKECSQSNTDKLHKQEMFVGFKTANNKEIKISEHALAKTKNVFEDFNHEIGKNIKKDESMKENLLSHQKTEAEKYKNILKEPSTSKNSLKNSVIEPNTACGFVTASKRPVIISTEALIKSKKLFEDIDSVKDKIEMLEEKDNLYKFVPNYVQKLSHSNHDTHQTKCNIIENNKVINGNKSDHRYNPFKIPSFRYEENNENVRKGELFEDLVDKSCEAKINYGKENNHQVFKGFQTASNKQVNVSEKSLAASKKIFEGLKINENWDNYVSTEKQTILSNKNIHETSPQTKFNNIQTDSDKLNKWSKNKPHYNDEKVSNIHYQGSSGFRSASDKVINISEQALAKSKNLFLDLVVNNHQTKNNRVSTDYNKIDEKINCFHTNNRKNSQHCSNDEHRDDFPNSKRFKVSNEDLLDKISQNSDEENNQIPNTKPPIENITSTIDNKQSTDIKDEIENIMNTQILKNFEDTLYTEDFCKEVPNNKRCGSPILSCPRAKKPKRFEVPYNKWEIPKTKTKVTDTFEVNSSIVFTFDKNYKKNNKFSMTVLRDIELNKSAEVDPYILTFNFENTLNFKFTNKRNEISEAVISTEDVQEHFLSLVNRRIIPDGWLENHLKLIIFKLISYEKEYKYALQGICSVKNVLHQLKYRYDRELYNVERPAFRKLLEKDDVSTKTMVLRVVAIYVDGVITESKPETSNIELLLTDGWYCIKSSLDQMLTRLVRDRKIRVGTKLVTNGAKLLNCEQGIAPWEDTSSVRLKLFGNSTRRARCDAKLGYRSGAAILSRLSRVQLEGGNVSKLRALVTRVYPTLYVEKLDDGSTVTRSERLEHLHQMKFESDRQVLLEKIYEEVEKEFIDVDSQDSDYEVDLRNVETGSQIHRLMKKSIDSGEFIANLTNTQCAALQTYTDIRRERVFQTLQDKVIDRVKQQGLQVARNVVPVMKIRVADVSDDGEVSKAMMSIWRPNEVVLDIIKEGTWIDAFNILPTARRYSEIQLSAGRQTVFSRSNPKINKKVQQIVANLKRNCYSIESLVKIPTAITDYNEIDVVGLIFLIEPSNAQFNTKGQHFQNVYLTDADRNIICVNFWGGLKKFGYENILDTGLAVACMNLQKRTGNSRKGIPQYRATEYSYFTKTSKHANVRIMMDDLNKKLSSTNIKQMCQSCVAIKDNNTTVKNVESISPYRINYSDYNISKHKAFIDSPLARKPDHVDDILNLSVFDFESSFNQNDTHNVSTDVILRKNKVNEKIAKLKMYGEPPPLKSIQIINKSKNATKEFQSPLASRNDSLNNVASNSAIICMESTPDISNKLMKRMNANPVKLNFCSNPREDDCDKIDPFAEEFDYSPPLSLD